MLPFRTAHGARFECRADFATGSVLNLNFFDEARAVIPFHLSVRRDEGLIVVNRRDAAGWRRELRFPARLPPQATPILVAFKGNSVSVEVAGKPVGRFDKLPRPDREGRYFLRRGFPALSQIAFVDIDGPTVSGSLLIDSPDVTIEPSDGKLSINDALEVELIGLTPERAHALTKAAAAVRIPGFDDPIPAVVRALPYALRGGNAGLRAHALCAVLPGRIWDGGAESVTVHLDAADGTRLGETTLARTELVSRIARLAASGALETDDRAALQAIEHARHAGVLASLSPEARASLLKTAARFRLGRYLLNGVEDTGAPQSPAKDPEAEAFDRVARAVDRFMETLRLEPGSDPVTVAETQLRALDVPPRLRSIFLINLTEWFCTNDLMPELAALWSRHDLPRIPASEANREGWQLSALAAHSFASGAFDDVPTLLWALKETGNSWVSTAALGWVAGRVAALTPDAQGRIVPAHLRIAMIEALIAFMDDRAWDYWGRVPCEQLMSGMIALLEAHETLPHPQHEALTWALARVYGLSPTFWRRIDARFTAPLPPLLAEARESFRTLEEAVLDGPGTPRNRTRIEAALGVFQLLENVDTLRYRRDLLGTEGTHLEPGALPDWRHCLHDGLNPDDAVVRHIANPLATHDAPPPAPFRDLIRNGIAAAHHRVPRSATGDLQRAAFRDLSACLNADSTQDLHPVLAKISALSGAKAEFLGLGLGMSLVRGLSRQSREDEALRVARHVVGLVSDLAATDARPWLTRANAPRMALAALLRDAPDHAATTLLAQALDLPGVTAAKARAEDRAADLVARANPLLDTLVCLYTCRPNLETRIKAIRETWLPLLEDLGIPHLIFVGDGDGRREGDIVHLDAPDTYEGLPQKTLALVQWVLDHTSFSYLQKIDDDCFLDPAEFHGGLSCQKFAYYGRPLIRTRGAMDRGWHMAKSRTQRGKFELDKSPEPSIYADGSVSYVLSRHAMSALSDAVASPEGQELQHLSFMEDKLVGDLLALRKIQVSGEDFICTILRRTVPGGPLVPQWDNGFLPFSGSGVRVAHLDGHDKMAEVLAASKAPWPATHKVWPSFQDARLGWRSNTLDLISSVEKLKRVNEAEVAVVACLRNELFMLQHFLDHHRALGVTGFLIADNGSDDGTFEFLADQPDVALFAVDTDYSESSYGVAWQQALLSNFRTNRWSLIADADEFLFWNAARDGSLPDLVARFEAEGADAARVFMLDMYPQGSLSGVDLKGAGPFEQAPMVDKEPFRIVPGARGPYSDNTVWTSALRHRLIPGSRAELFVAQKYALMKYRPWMRLSAGLHFVTDLRLARQELFFGHFKYNAAFREKAQAEVARQQHFNNAEEYRKYLALVSEGRDVVSDPQISVRWDACDFVTSRLAR